MSRRFSTVRQATLKNYELNRTLSVEKVNSRKDRDLWYVLRGDIYGDTLGEFKDGERIITKFIVNISEDGQYASTMRSRYKLDPPLSKCPASLAMPESKV